MKSKRSVQAVVKGEGSWSFFSGKIKTLYRVHRSKKSFQALDTMGKYWLIGIAEVSGGEICYSSKDIETRISGGKYVICLPPWSLVRSRLVNLEQRIVCVFCESLATDCKENAFIAKKWRGNLPQSETAMVVSKSSLIRLRAGFLRKLNGR